MDKYLNLYREMISLRGLTDHTLNSYSTYIRSYLDYLQNILHKSPENVSWLELRDFIKWLQKERNLFLNLLSIFLHNTGLSVADRKNGFFPNRQIYPNRLIPFSCLVTFMSMKNVLDGQNVSPVILSGMR